VSAVETDTWSTNAHSTEDEVDRNRFDDMTRALSERGSRRGALRLLAGSALGALVGAPMDALAKPKKKNPKPRCPKKACPKGYQRDKRTCECECVRTRCSGGKEFDTRKCRCKCPKGMRECRDGCVGLNECCPGDPPCPEDPKGCCHAPGLDVCTIDGCCRELDGMKACNDFCVDTNTHPSHCGNCNSPCGSDETCVDGECVPENPCPKGLAAQGLCCTDGRISCSGPSGPFCAPAKHTCCGDNSCDESQVCCDASQGVCCTRGRCVAGQCCPDGRKVCRDECVDTQTDRKHCGGCDGWCNGPGLECCAGSCKNLQSDEEHCGACGNACDSRTERCVEGQCRDICSLNQPPWQNRCDDGGDYWCCPDGSTQCCRLSGAPHCC
jgi:hypothetical protein